jgi:hypothetical protein
MALPKPPQVKRDVYSFPNTHQWSKIRSRPIVISGMKIGIVIAVGYILYIVLRLFPHQASLDVLLI